MLSINTLQHLKFILASFIDVSLATYNHVSASHFFLPVFRKTSLPLIASLAKNILHSFLILWVGILAPLVFFNSFATSHIVPPYRIALFEQIPPARPQRPNEIAPPSQWQHKSQQHVGQQASLMQRNPLSSLAQSLISAVGYLSVFATMLLPLLLGQEWLNRTAALMRRSAYLPPPDKPPRYCSVA